MTVHVERGTDIESNLSQSKNDFTIAQPKASALSAKTAEIIIFHIDDRQLAKRSHL